MCCDGPEDEVEPLGADGADDDEDKEGVLAGGEPEECGFELDDESLMKPA